MTTYIQISRKLRIHRPGKPDLVSTRPVDRKGRYTDTAKSTLIEIGKDCAVNVERMLRIGVIQPRRPDPIPKPKEGKEVKRGKATG
jgi:hypothetical protein